MEASTVDVTTIDRDSGPEPGLFAPEWRALTIGCIALISMLAFESLAVTTAMPSIATALDGLDAYALAFGATLATSVLGMVVAGQRCDRFGPRGPLRVGVLVFAGGLALAGFASDITMLVLGRAVLGFGSGQLGVALYVVVGRLYPVTMRPRIFAMFAAAWVVPALVGPALASLMVAALGWRSVFLAVLVLLPLAWWWVDPALRDLRGDTAVAPDARRRLVAAIVAATAAMLLHLLGQQTSPSPWLIGTAVILLAASSAHLLPADTLRARGALPTVIALRGLLAAAFFTAEAFLPLWLQQRQGWSVLAAGLAISAGALSWSAGSQTQARLARVPRDRILRAGLIVVASGLATVTLCAAGSLPSAIAVLAWLACGFGVGLSFPSLSVRLLELSAANEQGRNSAALQLADALATTAALAMAGLAFAPLHRLAPTYAFSAVFALAIALSVLAAIVAPRAWRVGAR
jgi:MFS family permease